jgi:hypothetical protein
LKIRELSGIGGFDEWLEEQKRLRRIFAMPALNVRHSALFVRLFSRIIVRVILRDSCCASKRSAIKYIR